MRSGAEERVAGRLGLDRALGFAGAVVVGRALRGRVINRPELEPGAVRGPELIRVVVGWLSPRSQRPARSSASG